MGAVVFLLHLRQGKPRDGKVGSGSDGQSRPSRVRPILTDVEGRLLVAGGTCWRQLPPCSSLADLPGPTLAHGGGQCPPCPHLQL